MLFCIIWTLGPRFSSYSEFLKQLLGEQPEAPDAQQGNQKKQPPVKRPGGKLPDISRMKLLPDIDKHGTVTDQLTCGRELLVQIVKEPISSKGPRLTTEISFTGRYMVLIPFSDKISISQKIKTTSEKLRLRHLVESIKPKNFGVIIRTSAEGKTVSELNHELQTLLQSWNETIAKARTAPVPSLIFEEESRIVGVLRDVFSPSFEDIHVNDPEVMAQIKKYVSLIAPEKVDIVKLYDKDEPIFDHFSITRQIKSSFGKTVSFKSGAYIIIEHTEALHVIDVNSGNRAKAGNDQETNALDVNIRAADEIARQLRLRDMGGIIVVDFIDMNKAEHRQALFEHMRQIMATDRARHNILPLSKFGLMQIDTPARPPGSRYRHHRSLSFLLWQGGGAAVASIHRYAQGENFLSCKRPGEKEFRGLRSPICRCLSQEGIDFTLPAVAHGAWRQVQGDGRRIARLPAI